LEIIASDDAKIIEELSLLSSGRTVVFVRSPDKAAKLASTIAKKKRSVPIITGEQRGFERDALVESPAFQPFTGECTEGDHWLVATSAGEVGINISCDRLISEFDTADHLIQRFGRLNRFGETKGVATVVYSAKKATEQERRTVEYLESLEGDVSPRNLRENTPPADCFSLEPLRASMLPWHIDAWSMTSLTEKDWPSRPEVDPWLRGEEDKHRRKLTSAGVVRRRIFPKTALAN
jgi:CRISPR-associated endonuclease/helicase Cas3